jgi:hypothetical protein
MNNLPRTFAIRISTDAQNSLSAPGREVKPKCTDTLVNSKGDVDRGSDSKGVIGH